MGRDVGRRQDGAHRGEVVCAEADEEASCYLASEPAPRPAHPGLPAGWFWIGLIAAIGAYELWAIRTGHQTLSQFVRYHTTTAVKWAIFVGLSIVGWHIAFGGPL